MSYSSRVSYKATAGQTDFDIPFPYIDRTHVELTINKIPFAYTWLSDTRIRTPYALSLNDTVTIKRDTPIEDALVVFHNGSVLTAEEQNLAIKQLIYKLQENDDLFAAEWEAAKVRLGDDLGIVTNAHAVMDQLRNMVLADELLAEFQQRIVDIDLNADAIINVALNTDRIEALIDVVDAKREGLEARANAAISNVHTLANTVIELANFGGNSTLVATIIGEKMIRESADETFAQTFDLIGSKNGDNTAFILNLDTVRTTPTESFAQTLEGMNANTTDTRAMIVEESTVRANAISAEASRLEGIMATVSDGANAYTEAMIFEESTARANAISAEATRLEGVVATMGNAANTYSQALVLTEENARVTNASAMANTISLVQAELGNTTAYAYSEISALSNANVTTAATLSLLGAVRDDGQAFILNSDTVLVSDEETLAERYEALMANTANALSLIQTESETRITNASSLASQITTVGSNFEIANAAIVQQLAALTTNTNAIAQSVTQLAAEWNEDIEAAVLIESNARANAIMSVANTITVVEAKTNQKVRTFYQSSPPVADAVGDLWFDTDDGNRPYRWSGSAWVDHSDQRFADLVADLSGFEADVATQMEAQTSNTSALAFKIDRLGAMNGANTAFILNDQTVFVNASTSLAQHFQGLATRLGNAEAAIISNATAWVTNASAQASSISGLIANAGGLSSSITTLQQVSTDFGAKWGVALDVNGHVTGVIQNNDGATGEFVVVADVFAIVDPNGGDPFVPFEVSDGVTRIRNALIGNLNIGSLGSGTYNGEFALGTGKIIFDNGVYMRAMGIGFGTQGQFMDWFGPKMALNLCSESNAKWFLKNNGDGYFGGSLSVGTLRNSYSTSDLSATASISTGFFGTNGGPKTVVVSWSHQVNGDQTGQFVPTYSVGATLNLYRTLAGGGEVLVSSTTIPNGGTMSYEHLSSEEAPPNGKTHWTASNGGSFTFTDNTAGLQDFSYRAQISRTGVFTGAGLGAVSQRVTVVSTEG